MNIKNVQNVDQKQLRKTEKMVIDKDTNVTVVDIGLGVKEETG